MIMGSDLQLLNKDTETTLKRNIPTHLSIRSPCTDTSGFNLILPFSPFTFFHLYIQIVNETLSVTYDA